MTNNGVRWHSMAKVQRDVMPEKDRRRIEKALAALEGLPPDQWPSRQAVRLKGAKPQYLLIAPKGWRAVISPAANNGIEVHFITHEETIRFLQGKAEHEGHQG
jgi:hypothetical protein